MRRPDRCEPGVLAGENVDEIAFLLAHRDANVTPRRDVRELADAGGGHA